MNKDTRQQTKIAPQAFSAANLRDASIGRRSSQGRNGILALKMHYQAMGNESFYSAS